MPVAPLELHDVSFAYGKGLPLLAGVDLSRSGRRVRRDRGAERRRQDDARPSRARAGAPRPAARCCCSASPHNALAPRDLAYLAQRSQLGGKRPATVREVVSAGRLARAGLLGPAARAGPRSGGRGRSNASASPSVGRAGPFRATLGQSAATSLHREGARRRAVAPGPRRAHHRRQRRRPRRCSAALLDHLHRDLDVTVLYVSHEFGAVERYVERLVLVRGGIAFDGPPGLPGPASGTTPRTSMLEHEFMRLAFASGSHRLACSRPLFGFFLVQLPPEPDRRRDAQRRVRGHRVPRRCCSDAGSAVAGALAAAVAGAVGARVASARHGGRQETGRSPSSSTQASPPASC